MSEILRVFVKDARRMWVTLAALAALLALADMLEVRRHFHPDYHTNQVLDLLTTVALPLTWIAVIAGAVLQDAVVGERQDWLTRPIARWQMLGAKVLFVVVFVNGFWFVSDCAILVGLGLRVPVLELIVRQAPMTVLLFLPAICLATLVGNVGQFVLGLLVSGLGMAFEVMSLEEMFGEPVAGYSSHSAHVALWIVLALLGACGIVSGFLRFSRIAKWVTFVIAVWLIPLGVARHSWEADYRDVSLSVTPELSATQLDHFQILFDFGSRPLFPDITLDHFGLPVKLEGLPAGVEVHGRGSSLVSIEGTEGEDRNSTLHQDADGYWLIVSGTVPEHITKVKLDLSLELFRTKQTKTVKMHRAEVFSPADGFVCNGDMDGFLCWHAPEFEHHEMLEVIAYSGQDSEMPGDFLPAARFLPAGFSPVVEQDISLSDRHKWQEVRFSTKSWVGQVRRSLTADAAELKH